MELRRQKALTWLFLVAYALTSAFWAKGLVLCIESDGHVTIEAASSDCSDCCSANGVQERSQGAQDGSREAPKVGACDCLDVALSVGNSTAAKKGPAAELQRAALAAFEPLRWTSHGRLAPAFSAELPRSHASSALTFLRSVVLHV